ncbi:alpha-L-rhamnosidase C-terminal domain-containing protein [Micromonospora sp. DT81.3]|uniref:alpha-L-rhamnosidase C-terminal domain-containing protein n=1 Tax=Micromonospora sp. DT81.3 TaxID=3416523 RepID=UPI003CEFE444
MAVGALAASVLIAPTAAWSAPGSGTQWEDYVLGPDDADVRPVAVVSVSGDVTKADSLTDGGDGVTLTMTEGGAPPVVVLDYGVNVGGIPYFDVTAVSGTPTLRASFSESLRFIDEDGDNGGEGPCCGAAPPAAEPFRWNEFSPTGPGVLRTEYQQGGERYERVALTTPGSITLSGVGIEFKPFLATLDDFEGNFLSSDDTLNRLWYSGAYTQQLNMVPPGTQNNNQFPAVIDGAKRDRAIWSGDLVVQNPVGWVTYGENGDQYMRDSLKRLALTQRENGIIAGSTRLGEGLEPPFALYYSATYSMHAANTMVDYYRYTGDEPFAQEALDVVRRQLDFDRTLVDARGLLVTAMGQGDTPPPPICCALDWDAYDPPKIGAVTAYNVVYYHTLREAAWLETQLGNTAEAASLENEAETLKAAINEHLWNPELGLYDLSDTRRGQFAQDANSMAVLWGVAPEDQHEIILQRIQDELWVPAGVQHFSDNAEGFQLDVLVPFGTGFDTAARFNERDSADALELLRRHWGPQVDPSTPDYTGSFWEKVSPEGTAVVDDGSNPIDNNSLAHGWSSAPTSQLSEYVLGVRPIGPGYREFVVAPQTGDLQWAKGDVPTAYGPVQVAWEKKRNSLNLKVETPDGATGSIELAIPARSLVKVKSKSGVAFIPVWEARTVSVPAPHGDTYAITALTLSDAALKKIRDVVGARIDDYLQGNPVPARSKTIIERLIAQYGA